MITSINEFRLNENRLPLVKARDKDHLEMLVKANIKQFGNNCDLNYIDVSNITDMSWLFDYSGFNGDISNWDVSNVTDMQAMFYHSKFNGDISRWDVSNVINMYNMFVGSPLENNSPEWYIDIKHK